MKFANLKNFAIRKCVFLVKSVQNGSVYFTQYHRPEVRPLKIFYQGLDVTQHLTFSTTLTNYSYFFLSHVSQRFGFTTDDIRAYFKINKKAKNLLLRRDKEKTPLIKHPGLGSSEANRSGVFDNTKDQLSTHFVSGGFLLDSQVSEVSCSPADNRRQDDQLGASQFGDQLQIQRIRNPRNCRIIINYFSKKLIPKLRSCSSLFEAKAQFDTLNIDENDIPSLFVQAFPKLVADPSWSGRLIKDLVDHYSITVSSETTCRDPPLPVLNDLKNNPLSFFGNVETVRAVKRKALN